MSEKRGLEQLQVWRRAMDLAVIICRDVIPCLPSNERYSLTTQLRRAVQSIPANIAEAHGRYHYTDAIRFLYIARGSLDETRSHMILAMELGYLPEGLHQDVNLLLNEVGRKLNGYIRYQAQQRRQMIHRLEESPAEYVVEPFPKLSNPHSPAEYEPADYLHPNPQSRVGEELAKYSSSIPQSLPKNHIQGANIPINKDLS